MAERRERDQEQVPSGSDKPAEGAQGSGTQKPADANPPRPGGASWNSEQGFSDPRNAPEGTPAPQMAENREADNRPQADKTDPNTVHTMRGMQIGSPTVDQQGNPVMGTGMIGGGNIARELLPPPPEQTPGDLQMQWARRAMKSQHFGTLAGLSGGRSLSDWGLVGKGATVRGLFLGIDVDTLEKVLIHDGHRIEEDKVYANVRQFDTLATTGDALQEIGGGR